MLCNINYNKKILNVMNSNMWTAIYKIYSVEREVGIG